MNFKVLEDNQSTYTEEEIKALSPLTKSERKIKEIDDYFDSIEIIEKKKFYTFSGIYTMCQCHQEKKDIYCDAVKYWIAFIEARTQENIAKKQAEIYYSNLLEHISKLDQIQIKEPKLDLFILLPGTKLLNHEKSLKKDEYLFLYNAVLLEFPDIESHKCNKAIEPILGIFLYHSCDYIAFWLFGILMRKYGFKDLLINKYEEFTFHCELLNSIININVNHTSKLINVLYRYLNFEKQNLSLTQRETLKISEYKNTTNKNDPMLPVMINKSEKSGISGNFEKSEISENSEKHERSEKSEKSERFGRSEKFEGSDNNLPTKSPLQSIDELYIRKKNNGNEKSPEENKNKGKNEKEKEFEIIYTKDLKELSNNSMNLTFVLILKKILFEFVMTCGLSVVDSLQTGRFMFHFFNKSWIFIYKVVLQILISFSKSNQSKIKNEIEIAIAIEKNKNSNFNFNSNSNTNSNLNSNLIQKGNSNSNSYQKGNSNSNSPLNVNPNLSLLKIEELKIPGLLGYLFFNLNFDLNSNSFPESNNLSLASNKNKSNQNLTNHKNYKNLKNEGNYTSQRNWREEEEEEEGNQSEKSEKFEKSQKFQKILFTQKSDLAEVKKQEKKEDPNNNLVKSKKIAKKYILSSDKWEELIIQSLKINLDEDYLCELISKYNYSKEIKVGEFDTNRLKLKIM